MAARSPPVGLDHLTVVPTNLHPPDEGDRLDEENRLDAGDRVDEDDSVSGDAEPDGTEC